MIKLTKEERDVKYKRERDAYAAFMNRLQKELFTEADVLVSLEDIRTVAPGDDESAHVMEKALWMRVLQELAKSTGIAHAALKTGDIEFSRWFA